VVHAGLARKCGCIVERRPTKTKLEALRPLIARDHCEVVFNFMFDFINRFALSDDPLIANILDRLIPDEDWRGPLRSLDAAPTASAVQRKRTLVNAFKTAVSQVGRFPYVAEVDVQRPGRARTLYFLVYGTRQPAGIKEFRDCQIKSLEVQSDVLARKKVTDRSAIQKQTELLSSMHDMAPDPHKLFLACELSEAKTLLLALIPASGSVTWGSIWPQVLAKNVVRLTDLSRAANIFRKEGLFSRLGQALVKFIPKDKYLVRRGEA
jgi:hypothetical protein